MDLLQAKIEAITIVIHSFLDYADSHDQRRQFLREQMPSVPILKDYILYNDAEKALDLKSKLETELEKQRTELMKQRTVQMQQQFGQLSIVGGPSVIPPVSAAPSRTNIIKTVPDKSASTIALNPTDYEEFSALSEIVASYVSNDRLRSFCQFEPNDADLERLQLRLRMEYHWPLTLAKIEGGSETKVVDSNLKRMVKTLVDFFPQNEQRFVEVKKKKLVYNYMAKSDFPEHSIYDLDTGVVLLGGEAKGLTGSTRKCCSQLITVCGNAALQMFALGIPRDACVVLGVALADSSVQFGAVYLMDESFPVFQQLTPPLHPRVHLKEIATWLLRCVHAASKTMHLLRAPQHRLRASRPEVQLNLNIEAHFVKPVRGQFLSAFSKSETAPEGSVLPGRLDDVLQIYEQLRVTMARLESTTTTALATPARDWSVLFPVGCISVPTADTIFRTGLTAAILRERRFHRMQSSLSRRPCLVFPRLPMAKAREDPVTLGEWRDTRPPAQYAGAYLAAVRNVVNFLNEANVAHFDLRPSNLLWRVVSNVSNVTATAAETEERVEVVVIDFDDAFVFGALLPAAFVQCMLHDRRFPLYGVDATQTYRACAVHNNFFVGEIERWLAEDDQTASFDSFILREA